MAKKVQESPYNKSALIIIGGIIALLLVGGVTYQQGFNTGKNQAIAQIEEKTVSEEESEIDTSSKVEVRKLEIEPTTLSGYGSKETESIKLESGLYDIRFTHDGRSNYVVQLVNEMGTKLDILANEIGSYDKTLAMSITNKGPYTFDVMADGNWSITVSEYTRDQ